MVSNERIVFCLKLWIKELHERKKQDSATTWVITTVEREVLTGEYCDDEEFKIYNESQKKVSGKQK